MNIDFDNIGKIICNTRKNKLITKKEMAQKVGVSVNYISKVENGKVNMDLIRFIKMCNYLNVSIYDVLNEENKNKIEYMNKELYEIIMKCDKQRQKLIYLMVTLILENQIK